MAYIQKHSVNQVILKVAGRCNLNCSYCYVYNSEDKGYLNRPKFLSDEIYAATLKRMAEYCAARPGHAMSLAFHGGEPTLIGVSRFQELVAKARAGLRHQLRSIAIQTNGTLIDATWARALAELGVTVSVSLDGTESSHDANRVRHDGSGSYHAAIRGINALREAGIRPNVLCVVNPHFPGDEMYLHLRSLGVEAMSFLLPDVSHDNYNVAYGSLEKEAVGTFLLEALRAWADEDNPGITVHIFEGLLRRLLGGVGGHDDFGNVGSNYLVVETDGSIEGNDVLRVCEDGMAKTGLNVVRNGFDDLGQGGQLVYQAVLGLVPLPTKCTSCPERGICGGGYLPHRYSRAAGFNNPSVWCADIKKLLAGLRSYLPAT